MKNSIIWKLITAAVITGWAVLNLVPFQDTPFEEFIESRATENKEEFAELLEEARGKMKEDSTNYPTLFLTLRKMGEEQEIDYYNKFFPDINLIDIANLEKRNNILLDVLLDESQSPLKKGLDLQGGTAFTLRIDKEVESEYEREQNLEKAIEIMGNRVNGLGVAEPLIRAVPPDGIEIQMPGLSVIQNPGAADSLKKAARLEFRLVHRTAFPGSGQDTPIGYEVLVMENEDRETGEIVETPMYIKVIPEATGRIISQAGATIGANGAWEIMLNMTDEGTDVFGKLTKRMVDNDAQMRSRGRLAIVLDGKLYSAPGVNEPILNGRASISGDFSQREAFELANVLNNPLEFDLKLDEMYEVGPTLAEDARDASVNAALLGAALVIGFMIVYYVSSGFIAVISVFLNMLIVLGTLASLGATLTLPGVAALVLTIGMAVDANILIFERIREELNIGKTLKTALQAGYEKAFSTIIDANVTTLITAGILIKLGTGPVKGFGVTLAIGIAASMFGALVISRAFLEMLVYSEKAKSLMAKRKSFGSKEYSFLDYRKGAFIASWIVVALGLVTVGIKGDKIYGIDFLGGSEISIEFNEANKPEISKILEVAQTAELGEIQPVYQRVIGGDAERLKVQTEEGKAQLVFNGLNNAFPEAEMKQVGENLVGAAVSSAIKKNAFISVMVALLGILLYVALRFEVGYGIGAVVATVHDVFMTIGIFVMFGNQFTAPMLASILMIVGYSINDTIVVFDRIREELELNPDMTLGKVVNLAISRTLSRTILTSITTFLAALSLFIFGAGVIRDFAFVFMVGIITGTFSSIFIASPVFYWWHKGDRKHVEEREMVRPTYEWEATSKKAQAGNSPQ